MSRLVNQLVNRGTAVVAALAVVASVAAAQQSTTITGHVTTEAGSPLSAASVAITSLGLGAYTNDQGVYTITVPAARMNGQAVSLTARRVGYAPKTFSVTLNSGNDIQQDFSLNVNATTLTGVVISALGVERPKSQLGTAVQQVSSEQLNATHDQNIINQLAGKVSGVAITSSGTQGGSTKITIRGANSITGNNDPLFIVDGTPVSNRDRGGSPNGGALGGANTDFGSVINDINPDDIATVTVLKGPNAAAIYGSRGANGVVLITTKRGSASSQGIQTAITSSMTWDTPSILPKFQNQYGQGSGGQFAFVDGAGGGNQDFNDQSFGPKLDGRLITQFNGPVVNGVIQPSPWVAHPDNVSSFFQTGRTFSNNLAFSGGTDRATGRLSLGDESTTGIVPNNTLRKFSGSLAGNFTVSSRLTTSANVQYINNKGHNRPGVGYNTGIVEGLYVWFGRQVDMNALKSYQPQANQTYSCNGQSNWNCNYHNNPYWIQYQNPETDNRDHIIASGSATWKVTDWLNATAASGTDYFRYNIAQNYDAGNLNYNNLAYNGAFSHFNNQSNENNSSLLLSANKRATNWLQLNATFGANRRYATYASNSAQSNAILAAGIWNVSNSAVSPTVAEYNERRQTNSGYGSGSFTVNDVWTVEVTGRNDWSSTLPKGNNSFFYPSVNTSLVLSDMFPRFLKNNVISYAKIRGSIANVGNDADPYQLATVYVGNANKFGSLPQYSLSDTRANPSLRPENTNSGEVGLEIGFFNNRATLDASYYAKATTNEIVNLTLAPETGFNAASINAGKLTNKGLEGLLTIIPIQTESGFQWTSTMNYAANRSKLVTLYPGVNNYVIGSTWTINEEARVGQPYGAIFATPYLRDASGNLLLSGGLPQNDAAHRRVLGNVNPKWTGGWNNEIRWGRMTASALLDIHRGGNIYSVTNMFGQYTGVLASSMTGREVDWNNPGLVVRGTDQATGKPNTVNVTAEDYYQSLFQNGEAFLFDDSFIKLREVRVGFDLPRTFTRSLRVSTANLAFVGRNLWTQTKVPNIDPEFAYTTGNYQGAEFAALPTTRSLGINLRITP
ncbi:MAG: SusC/RagA family TonB-linked outer membrane protein [Gemmatimonadota bacterium]|nr:SusC/RagA family TonB-linked outer membrane protein [Gemmatimonadota bacterium]